MFIPKTLSIFTFFRALPVLQHSRTCAIRIPIKFGFRIRFFVPEDSKFMASKSVFDAETGFCIKPHAAEFQRQARDEVDQVPSAFYFSDFLWPIWYPQCLQRGRGPRAGNPARATAHTNFTSNVNHLSASYGHTTPSEAGSIFLCRHGRHDLPGLTSRDSPKLASSCCAFLPC